MLLTATDKEVCVQLPMSAVNVTLLAFAAERCVAVGPCCSCQSISPAATPTAANPLYADGKDRQTETVPLHRPQLVKCKNVGYNVT